MGDNKRLVLNYRLNEKMGYAQEIRQVHTKEHQIARSHRRDPQDAIIEIKYSKSNLILVSNYTTIGICDECFKIFFFEHNLFCG